MICDCPSGGYHRWNCSATPTWAQAMRDLDINPWTVLSGPIWDDHQDFPWLWHYCLLCPGCGEDKDIGIHGSYSPFGGCV